MVCIGYNASKSWYKIKIVNFWRTFILNEFNQIYKWNNIKLHVRLSAKYFKLELKLILVIGTTRVVSKIDILPESIEDLVSHFNKKLYFL